PVENPPNPYESTWREYLEPPPLARLEVFEERARSILSRNNSPDLSFRWSLNPYRGCFHGCAYCYARPTHEYLGFGAGTDFDTKIVVKMNAPELLRQAFERPSWQGELIVFSGDTDCYQPVEAVYRLTQQCLEVCVEFCNPVAIITKSYLILRDVELLQELVRRASLHVTLSIAFRDDATAKLVEPQAASISRRFDALKRLSHAGIPTSILVAPIIPGLNDSHIPDILERAKDCGAVSAGYVPLRLPGNVKTVFLDRIRQAFPLRAKKIERQIRETRDGKLYNSNFFERYHGQGKIWEATEVLFQLHQRRLGLDR
ncbi:MAG: PA0069 family radical SAM protein, partial [Elusimicrobia bacterium]|nr:PA0069 family radical SAM protein [Elusimicrobiota bacterium]